MSLSPWSAFEPANVSFCEPRLDGWIAEPANAWSSMAYVVVGVWLLGRALRDKQQVLLLIGLTSSLVGLGSFAFHATVTLYGQFSDESSMFLISGLMLTLSLRRLLGWSSSTSIRVYVALATFSVVLLAVVKTSGIMTFTVQIGSTISLELLLAYMAWRRKSSVRYRALFMVLGMYTVASVVWAADLVRAVCEPAIAHYFSGHVVWHVLTALCLAVYYRFQEQFFDQTVSSPEIAVAAANAGPA